MNYSLYQIQMEINAKGLYPLPLKIFKKKTLQEGFFECLKWLILEYKNLSTFKLEGISIFLTQTFINQPELAKNRFLIDFVHWLFDIQYDKPFQIKVFSILVNIYPQNVNPVFFQELNNMNQIINELNALELEYYEKAIPDTLKAHLQSFLHKNTQFHYVWFMLGTLFFREDNYEEAINCYENAVKLEPKPWRNFRLMHNLFILYWDTKRFDNGFAYYNLFNRQERKFFLKNIQFHSDYELMKQILKKFNENKMHKKIDVKIKKTEK